MDNFIKEEPGWAVLIVILAFVVLIILLIPIFFLMLAVAFAYAKAFNSFWIGFAISVPVIFVGIMLGSLFAFLLGRYVLADWIRKKLERSKN